ASYSAHGSEMNPSPLTDALRMQGHKIALPVVPGKDTALFFCLYATGDKLVTGPMGILEPTADAQQVEPDILLVPLLAFTHDHHRLGYGRGYYDRTLKVLRAKKPVIAIG